MELFRQTSVGAVQDVRERGGGQRDAREDPGGLGEELRRVQAHVMWVLFLPPGHSGLCPTVQRASVRASHFRGAWGRAVVSSRMLA